MDADRYIEAMADEVVVAIREFMNEHPEFAYVCEQAIEGIEAHPNNVEVEVFDESYESIRGERDVGLADADYGLATIRACVSYPVNEFEVCAVVEGTLEEEYESEPNEDGGWDEWVDEYDIAVEETKVWVTREPEE